MKVEVWQSESEDVLSVFEHEADEKKRSICLEPDSVLLRIIEGVDWDDCMRQHYEIMGWNPYIPM